jgi:hypothetical protein
MTYVTMIRIDVTWGNWFSGPVVMRRLGNEEMRKRGERGWGNGEMRKWGNEGVKSFRQVS